MNSSRRFVHLLYVAYKVINRTEDRVLETRKKSVDHETFC